MLDAFGNVESNTNISARLIPALPVSAASLSGKQVGALYLGINKANPPQILSLLFQMESGAGNSLACRSYAMGVVHVDHARPA